jgi:hypothetical protein
MTSYQFQLVAFRGTLNIDAVFGAISNVATGTTTGTLPPPPPARRLAQRTRRAVFRHRLGLLGFVGQRMEWIGRLHRQ